MFQKPDKKLITSYPDHKKKLDKRSPEIHLQFKNETEF